MSVSALLGVGEPTMARDGEPVTEAAGVMRGDTCHIDVIDRHGNMVAATPSGGWFQSSPVVPGLGFSLSTRAQMCWVEEGLASTVAPGRRPRSTLSPSMALKDGEPYLAWGTPGGDQQDQWSLLLFLRHVHHGLNLQEAIEAPAFHSEHWPSSFWPREARPNVLLLEGQFERDTIRDLERRGHDVIVGEPWSEGRCRLVPRRCVSEPLPAGRRQPARHAGLCGRPLKDQVARHLLINVDFRLIQQFQASPIVGSGPAAGWWGEWQG
jgi:gamma-glutamyltranspeptidase / glutathione hydrolase